MMQTKFPVPGYWRLLPFFERTFFRFPPFFSGRFMSMMLRLLIVAGLVAGMTTGSAAQQVVMIEIDGPITGVTADYFQEGVDHAAALQAECLLVALNTPGGLLRATRKIVGSIFASPVPVVVYVSPGGAHAGSAGVFLTLAADVAAMAPGTNIGAAHPVNLGGSMDSVMGKKVTNDAAAFIKSVAEKRDRNWEWAIAAVEESQSITARTAVAKNVVDLLADNQRALLRAIDGRTIQLSSGSVTLHTRDATIVPLEMSTVDQFLNILSNPNIMYILLLLGVIGIVFEFFNPGGIVPGVAGGILLILAFYGMSMLPVNYAGVALILFAIILFVLEIKIVSHGILAVGGVVALFLGSMFLIRDDPSWDVIRLSWSVLITSVVLFAVFFITIISIGLRAQKARPVSGIEGFLGKSGEVLQDLTPEGLVRVQGEIWKAVSSEGTIVKGEQIAVEKVENLKLIVKRYHSLT